MRVRYVWLKRTRVQGHVIICQRPSPFHIAFINILLNEGWNVQHWSSSALRRYRQDALQIVIAKQANNVEMT